MAAQLKPFIPALVPAGHANLELNRVAELVGCRAHHIDAELEFCIGVEWSFKNPFHTGKGFHVTKVPLRRQQKTAATHFP